MSRYSELLVLGPPTVDLDGAEHQRRMDVLRCFAHDGRAPRPVGTGFQHCGRDDESER